MALIILGILVLITGYAIQNIEQIGRYAKIVRGIAVLLMIIGVLNKINRQENGGQIRIK